MRKLYFFIALLSIGFYGTAQNNVTFSVDMSSYGGTFTTVYLSGEMNAWDGFANPMTDMGGGIWSTTMSLANGDYEYKFQLDGWVNQENFTSGDPCTVTSDGYVNRILQVVGADMNLDTPDFDVCYDDGDPGPHNITFNLDMSGYGGTFTAAYISGEFNGWDGFANPLSNMGGDMWSVTLPLPESYTEFKFQLDGWADQEILVSGSIGTVTNSGFTNRYLNILGDSVKNYVWNTETTLNTQEFTADSCKIYPNPTNNSWNVITDDITISTIELYDISGRKIVSMTSNSLQTTIDGSRLQRGVYFAKVNTDRGSTSIKLVKN